VGSRSVVGALSSACRVGILAACLTATPAGQERVDLVATWADRPASGWVSAADPIRVSINRPLHSEEGRLAVVIGDTDWTGVCEAAGDGVTCRSGAVALPAGERELSIHLVSAEGAWRELARWPLKVRAAGGFEQIEATPAFDLQLKGQPYQDRTPVLPPTDRDTYRDTALNGSFDTTLARGGWTTRGSVNVLGASYAAERLRFGELQEDAPAVDLATYLVAAESPVARVSAGHISFNPQRHLVADFGARGVSAVLRPIPAVDVEVGATSATSLVGWSTPLGFTAADHRALTATVGVEAAPGRPGLLRLSGSFLDGSRRPQAAVTQGLVSDAERSRGASVRLVSSALARFSLDAGFARSRFAAAEDADLSQGFTLTPIAPATSSARFVDATFTALNQARLGATHTVTLVLGAHHEQIDPLYRSITAASVQSDQRRDGLDVTLTFGPAAGRIGYERSRDNLADIGSILTTRTRKLDATMTLPLGGWRRAEATSWLPHLTYQLLRLHQAGDGLPIDAEFEALSQVPDQLNTMHTLGVDWQRGPWHAGYRFNHSFQDNRQVGRAAADLLNATNVISFGVTPSPAADLSVEVGFDGAENRETARVDLTRRLAITTTLRPWRSSTLTAMLTRTRAFDRADTSESTNTDVNVEFGQSVPIVRRRPLGAGAQVFLRLARQTLRSFDLVFDQSNSSQVWVLNTGVTIRLQ
jgi:hypothetical protein